MTPEFLFIANVVLLTRLPMLLSDARCSSAKWLLKGAVELCALAFFVPSRFLALAAIAVIGFNLAGAAKINRRRYAFQLALGALHLGVFSILFSSSLTPHFRPSLLTHAHQVANFSTFGFWLQRLAHRHFLKITFGLLLSANESNLLIRSILNYTGSKPPKDQKDAEYNRGRIIGLIERGLVYLFVLSGQYSAIGFILAAKAFARFKKMDDQDFAEYVLIGTLLSTAIAMAIGILARV